MSQYKKYSMKDFIEKGYEILTDFMFQVLKQNGISLTISEDRINDAAYLIATDAEPGVHGKWREIEVDKQLIYCCTVCHTVAHMPNPATFGLYAYCPHCGAKMDGEEYETV